MGSSNGKDKHREGIRQGEGKKYPRKSCHHRIKCSVANSLTALMWRLYLNNDIQPYSYYTRLMEGTNGTSINTSHLACMWRTKMRGEGSIKGGRGNRRKGSRNKEKIIVASRTNFVIKSERNI